LNQPKILKTFLYKYSTRLQMGDDPVSAVMTIVRDDPSLSDLNGDVKTFSQNLEAGHSIADAIKLIGQGIGSPQAIAVFEAIALSLYFGTSSVELLNFIGVKDW
jgi:hypothetical protein